MRFSAAVLMGGSSRRMGRDKAALPAPPFASLLERQVAQLAALQPVELLVSVRENQPLPRCRQRWRPGPLRFVRDDGAAGPLGGLVQVLQAARAPRVLVVAVDLPFLDAPLLRRILHTAPLDDDAIGAMPRLAAHGPQPLAALWPVSVLSLAREQLRARETLALRALVERATTASLLRDFPVPSWDAWQFANWNHPADVVSIRFVRPSGNLHRI